MKSPLALSLVVILLCGFLEYLNDFQNVRTLKGKFTSRFEENENSIIGHKTKRNTDGNSLDFNNTNIVEGPATHKSVLDAKYTESSLLSGSATAKSSTPNNSENENTFSSQSNEKSTFVDVPYSLKLTPFTEVPKQVRTQEFTKYNPTQDTNSSSTRSSEKQSSTIQGVSVVNTNVTSTLILNYSRTASTSFNPEHYSTQMNDYRTKQTLIETVTTPFSSSSSGENLLKTSKSEHSTTRDTNAANKNTVLESEVSDKNCKMYTTLKRNLLRSKDTKVTNETAVEEANTTKENTSLVTNTNKINEDHGAQTTKQYNYTTNNDDKESKNTDTITIHQLYSSTTDNTNKSNTIIHNTIKSINDAIATSVDQAVTVNDKTTITENINDTNKMHRSVDDTIDKQTAETSARTTTDSTPRTYNLLSELLRRNRMENEYKLLQRELHRALAIYIAEASKLFNTENTRDP